MIFYFHFLKFVMFSFLRSFLWITIRVLILAVDITCKFKSICIIKVDVDFVDVYKSYHLDDQFSQLNNIFI